MDFKEKRQKAIDWATLAHSIQTKDGNPQQYDGKPYTAHLAEVESVLIRFGYNSESSITAQNLLVAAWLHDILEDTTVTYEELMSSMGKEVADLVYAVTNESGANRKERHLKTYPKIISHPDAIILKLADRIANTEASVNLSKNGSVHFLKMYKKEYTGFRNALYVPGVQESMWQHLDLLLLVQKNVSDVIQNWKEMSGSTSLEKKINAYLTAAFVLEKDAPADECIVLSRKILSLANKSIESIESEILKEFTPLGSKGIEIAAFVVLNLIRFEG